MKITEYIKKANKTLFSFEILPPLKGENISEIFNSIDPLMEFKPPFIDVTYHREEYFYKDMGNNNLKKIAVRKRPGTVGICSAIMSKYKVDTVPHIICGGFNKQSTEDALIDFNFLGINNVLVLRGDPIKSQNSFIPDEGGHKYASNLLSQVKDMNRGIYLDNDIENPYKTNFCTGIAGYPEKHFESPNIDSDLKYLKHKVDLGAEYIVTQLFYNNNKYFDFVKKCRDIGINVPIIPGIKPISTKKQLSLLPKTFFIDIPNDLVNQVLKCNNDKEVRQVGVEWAINQCKELIKFGVPVLHFYSMGKSDNIFNVAKEIF